MKFQSPLAVVTPTVDGEVLTILAHADAWFTTGQLHRLIPTRSIPGIRNALLRLAEQGTVETETVGRVLQFRLNRNHLAAPAIIALAQLQQSFIDRLAHEIRGWEIQPVYAALFGSAARGQMRLDSDIDLFVVQPDDAAPEAWTEQILALDRAASSWTGNDVRTLSKSEAEVRQGAGQGGVLDSISHEGIPISGEASWLRGMITAERS